MRFLLPGVVLFALFGSGCASGTADYALESAEPGRVEAGADRQIVKRAWLRLEVRDPAEATAQTEAIVGRADGMIESSSTSGDDVVQMALRVPAALLDQVLGQLRAVGTVESERISATDVTDEVTDLDARLTNLIAVRDRLRGYLDRAEDLEDVIAIERELTRVQTEIDSLTARSARLRSQVAMSQISVTLERRRVLGPLGLLVTGVAWVVEKLFVID